MRPVQGFFLAVYFGVFLLIALGIGVYKLSFDRSPKQPIAFTHPAHVLKVGMECTFCHAGANKARQAGIPSVETCMNCHRSIKTESPEIKKLAGYFQRKEPIPWVKVHNLKPFVVFTHKRHIKRGIPCSACHGEVQTMLPVRQVRSLSMGFCVECHKSYGAPLDCLTCHK